jgi:hypothetical protein
MGEKRLWFHFIHHKVRTWGRMQACDEALAGFSMAKHFTLLTQLLLYNIVFLSIIYKQQQQQ